MQYLELRRALNDFMVFSLSDIRSVEKNFHRRRLNEWQKKSYIKKIIRGYYIFSDLEISENVLFEIANRIYRPSYISFEMALSYYNLIPERVYEITSASTRRTYTFRTSVAEFGYRTIKPDLFFGYNLESYNGKYFKIASIEKAVLDYFYINPDLREESDFSSLRINTELFSGQVDEKRLHSFLDRFGKKGLIKRINAFMEFMKNA